MRRLALRDHTSTHTHTPTKKHLKQMMKLGPISKVMGMLPGLGQMMNAMGAAGMGDDEVCACVRVWAFALYCGLRVE